MAKFFRVPENGEMIEYDCGCIYRIRYTGEFYHSSVFEKSVPAWEIEADLFCVEHDPTLTEYAKNHEEDICDAGE